MGYHKNSFKEISLDDHAGYKIDGVGLRKIEPVAIFENIVFELCGLQTGALRFEKINPRLALRIDVRWIELRRDP